MKTLAPKLSYNELNNKKVFITRSKKFTFSPAEAFLETSQIKEDFSSLKTKNSFFDINITQISGMKGMNRLNNELIPNENINLNF